MQPSSSKTNAEGALGDAVVDIVERAQGELLLVAPYVKRGAINRALRGCHVSDLRCVTRWRPIEIAAGVSDLGVYEDVRDRGGSLWLRNDLHAKYYRGDGEVLVGSANLTGAALGWSAAPNLELLVPIPATHEVAVTFEQELFRYCILVTDELYEQFLLAEAEWRDALPTPPQEAPITGSEGHPPDLHGWLPQTRQPRDLYRVYSTSDVDALPIPMRRRAADDLAVLGLPPGLPEKAFTTAAATALLTTTIFHGIDSLVSTPQRFGAVRDFLMSELGLDRASAEESWQTMIRWLRHFLPHRYEYTRPRHSEVITRRR